MASNSDFSNLSKIEENEKKYNFSGTFMFEDFSLPKNELMVDNFTTK